ncbi:MAG: transketolase C-terminal domain-containing protein [Candidatus Pacearchaeota archaeon]
MARTLGETIKEIIRKHLEENNGLIMGQCLSAVGWVNNTIPNTKNIIEYPMTDVAGAGIAVGAAIVGRRPILVLRFQDFVFLNSSILVNFAAKRKYIFGKSAPIFIRSLAVEGPGIGPVHSGVFHNIFMHMPGFRVVSPMTPTEYEEIWEDFMKNDDPMYVSEHRRSFNQTEEMNNIIEPDADITLYGIGASRFNILEAAEKLKMNKIKCNIIHLLWLKPLKITEDMLSPLIKTKIGIVVDSGFEICGASQSVAYELMKRTKIHKTYVEALGAEDKSVGASERYLNTTPKVEKIINSVKNLLDIKSKL